MELSSPKIRKFIILFGLSPQNFPKIFLINFPNGIGTFLYFRNSIFRTLACLELEGY